MRCLLPLIPLLFLSAPAGADPLEPFAFDLTDPTPRDIQVRFEKSPRDLPGQVDVVYGEPLPAHVEALASGHVAVILDREIVESRVFANERVLPDSFSDFVWVFDPETGDVVSATVSGRLIESVDWGLMRTETETRIEVSMDTQRPSGFRPLRRMFGHAYYPHCDGADRGACTLVEPRPLDESRGYVNAVGSVDVQSAVGLGILSFSPLGEAVFTELPATPAVAAAPPSSGAGFASSDSVPPAIREAN